jgi:hypothetical protein
MRAQSTLYESTGRRLVREFYPMRFHGDTTVLLKYTPPPLMVGGFPRVQCELDKEKYIYP